MRRATQASPRGRHNPTATLIAATLFAASAARAECYIAFDKAGTELWRDVEPRIDISYASDGRTSREYAAFRNAGGRLLIQPDHLCQPTMTKEEWDNQRAAIHAYVASGQYDADVGAAEDAASRQRAAQWAADRAMAGIRSANAMDRMAAASESMARSSRQMAVKALSTPAPWHYPAQVTIQHWGR